MTRFAVTIGLVVALAWGARAQVPAAPQTQCTTSAIAGGSSDALTIPLLPCAFTTNLLILTPTLTNATTTPTLQMTGFVAQPIVNGGTSGVAIGELAAGVPILLTPTGSKWVVISGPGGGGGGGGNGITTLTGDVNASGPGIAPATIGLNAVTYSKFQQVAPLSLVGNSTNALANAQNVGINGQGLQFCSGLLCTNAPDGTATGNYTLAAADMAGQRNMNGVGLTLNIPAVSASVLAQGQTVLFDNQNASELTLSSMPTINGLASATGLWQYGWANCVSNGTSLDCVGFPGFGAIAGGALTEFIDSTGATKSSPLADTGQVLRATDSIDLSANLAFASEIGNDTSTGTTLAKLAKLTTSGLVILPTTSTPDGIVGIVIGGAGTSGSAQIARSGQALCVFDGSTTAGDYVDASTTTAGDCHDAGSSRPTGVQTIGQVLSTNGVAGTYAVSMALQMTNAAGGGSGTVNSGTGGQMAYYASSTTAVSGNPNANVSAGALTLGQAGTAGRLVLNGGTSGTATLQTPAVAGSATLFQLPATSGASANLLVNQGSGTTAWQAMSGDATLSAAGAITVTKSSGTAFGTAAFGNTGTTGHTIPYLDGNNTFSGTLTSTGSVQAKRRTATGSITISATADHIVCADVRSGVATVTMPATATFSGFPNSGDGLEFIVQDCFGNSTVNSITIAPASGQTIGPTHSATGVVLNTINGQSVGLDWNQAAGNWDLF